MMAAPLSPQSKPDLGPFDWADPFRLNDQLTGEERMLRDAAAAYAAEKLQPRMHNGNMIRCNHCKNTISQRS